MNQPHSVLSTPPRAAIDTARPFHDIDILASLIRSDLAALHVMSGDNPIAAHKAGKIEFMGLRYDNVTLAELLAWIDEAIRSHTPTRIFTPNVALLMWSRQDPFLKQVYNASEILTVDGYAIYYAMKLLRLPIRDTLSPSVFYHPLLNQANEKRYRVYLIGARPEVVQKNADFLSKEYPGIQVMGFHDGYFDVENPPAALIDDIAKKQVDLVLVGMTTPLKEKLAENYMAPMGASVYIGVGGMFDIIAGETKYAPKIMRVLALEWLYRLAQEPRRLWRRYLTTNSRFLVLLAGLMLKRYLITPFTGRSRTTGE